VRREQGLSPLGKRHGPFISSRRLAVQQARLPNRVVRRLKSVRGANFSEFGNGRTPHVMGDEAFWFISLGDSAGLKAA
jgi:hypothetical protein